MSSDLIIMRKQEPSGQLDDYEDTTSQFRDKCHLGAREPDGSETETHSQYSSDSPCSHYLLLLLQLLCPEMTHGHC